MLKFNDSGAFTELKSQFHDSNPTNDDQQEKKRTLQRYDAITLSVSLSRHIPRAARRPTLPRVLAWTEDRISRSGWPRRSGLVLVVHFYSVLKRKCGSFIFSARRVSCCVALTVPVPGHVGLFVSEKPENCKFVRVDKLSLNFHSIQSAARCVGIRRRSPLNCQILLRGLK